jgi:azurin
MPWNNTHLLIIFALLLFPLGFQVFSKPSAPEKKTVTLEVALSSKGNNIEFDQKSLEVPFGLTVTLKFANLSTPDSGIDHNIVILKPGTEEAFLKELQKNDYDLEKIGKSPHILMMSRILKPGEATSITVTPPKSGFYPYLCIMPGHGDMLGMKGILHVK